MILLNGPSFACSKCQPLRCAHVGNAIQVPPTGDPDENIDVFENRFEIHFGKSSILLGVPQNGRSLSHSADSGKNIKKRLRGASISMPFVLYV